MFEKQPRTAEARYAACDCGWLSAPQRSSDLATAAWRHHLLGGRHLAVEADHDASSEERLTRLAVEVEMLRQRLDRTGRPSAAVADLGEFVDELLDAS